MAIFGTIVPGETFGFRNRIINGDCRIAQRGTSAVTGSGDFPVDRFLVVNSTDGAFSAQQDSSAPTGFVNSVKVTVTTADGTLTTTQNINFQQRIEGNNVADLGWGTANAKTITLSFWVRSSLTGTFGGSLGNNGSNRWYPFTYSISVADTWEYKTVTVSGDTTGTWLTTTGIGIQTIFSLGAGPDRSGTAGAWTSSIHTAVTGQVQLISTLNATWYITGVQLEVGSVATPFERRPYGTEFQLCQRYYETWGGETLYQSFGIADAVNTTGAYSVLQYLVPKRVAPTISISSASDFHTIRNSLAFTSLTFGQIATTQTFSTINVASGMVAGQAYTWRANNTLSARINFSAEL